MSDSELTVTISGDTSKFESSLKNLTQQTDDFDNHLRTLALAAAEAFAAFEAINKPVEAYGELEKASNQLIQSMKTQGVYSDELLKSYQEQADAVSKLTGANEASVLQGQSIMQNLIGQKEITPELTKAVVDFAAANRMDLASAFELVGRSAYGTTMMLKRHGVEINESLSAQERLAKFTELATQKFDGQAEAATRGVGALSLVTVAFDKLEQAIGAKFAPSVEKAAHFMADLFNSASKNDTFVTLAEVTLTAVAAFSAYTAALKVATVATEVMQSAVKGLWGSTGIGLLVVAIVEVYQHWSTVWPAMQSVFHAFTSNVGPTLSALSKIIAGVFTADLALAKEGWNQFTEILSKGFDDAKAKTAAGEASLTAEQAKGEAARSAARQKAANDAQAQRDAQEKRRLAAEKAQRAVLVAEANQEAKALIDIKKQEAETLAKIENDKYAKVRPQLQKHLQDLRTLEASEEALSVKQKQKFEADYLKHNQEFQKMDAKQQQQFLLQHRQQLQANIDTEQSALEKAAVARSELQIKSDNQYLQDQIKFGTAYAAINQAMHSEIYQGTKQAFADMQEMQNSHNATLKAIGKIAAEANVVIKTAESAMNIYAGFSTIPIVGPELGLAAAAAAIAYGMEQFANIAAANKGGVIPGIGPDQDSVLSFLTPGELVVPRSNYDETVNAVADQRNGTSQGGALSNGDVLSVLKSIDGKVGQTPNIVLEPKDSGNDDAFWDYAIRRISARCQYANARLITSRAGT